jgi:hypothetical protein
MEQIFTNHRNLILGFGGGLIAAFCIYFLMVSPMFAAADKANQEWDLTKMRLESKLQTHGLPTESALEAARGDTDQLGRDMLNLTESIQFAFPPDFVLDEVTSKDAVFYYQDTRQGVIKALDRLASEKDVTLPEDIGFPEEVKENMAQALLYRLAVMQHSLTVALENGIDTIVEVQPVETRELLKSLEAKGFTARYPATFTVEGAAGSVMALLHGLQQTPTYLAVDQFKVTNENPLTDRLRATFSVSGIGINLDATFEESEGADVEGGEEGGEGGVRPERQSLFDRLRQEGRR